jgi:hypothetical protein
MIDEETLQNVAAKQAEIESRRDTGLPRPLSVNESTLDSHALVLTGVRRCGKSTLMSQRIRRNAADWFYLKFDSPQLVDMELGDSDALDRVIARSGARNLYFDEMHELDGWELYVLQKLDEGFRVCVTGSNASLLKGERATKLTGRHISRELFPFSFKEYCEYLGKPNDWTEIDGYLKSGGFPRFLATRDESILFELFDDIMYRDVVAKHGIREMGAVQRLAAYLIENPGCRFSATRMLKSLNVSVASTVINWCDWFEDAYLFFFVPKYSDSVRAQLVNPRKVYSVDTGLVNVVSRRIVFNDALCFENMVFLALRRKYRDIFYFDDGGECDFVCMEHHLPRVAVQACVKLTKEDSGREKEGLAAAMRRFSFNEGFIVTKSQREDIKVDEGVIHVVPFSDFEP